MEIAVALLVLTLVLGAPLIFALWTIIKVQKLERRVTTLARAVHEEVAADLARISDRVDRLEAGTRPRSAETEASAAASEPAEAGPPAGTGEAVAAAGVEGRSTGSRERPDVAPDEEATPAAGAGEPPPSAVPQPGKPADTGGAEAPGAAEARKSAPGGTFGVDVEELIGGAWLNRIGVLITVIGMALGLGYSFQYLGPAGRVGTSLLLSLVMLGGGIVLERRAVYRNYGRGLIGGGWAALYVTTYAAHAVDAARLIESPALASGLLMAVALGMIVHSLRYRSQAVTGTAFLVAFATLAITDLSTFAVVASIPLAGALLFVAYRFGWGGLGALGVVATYGAYLLSEGTLPRTGSALGDFVAGQATLFAYWLLFEGFDLLRLRGWLETEGATAERDPALAVAPLNAAGFIGVSLLQWSTRTPEMVGGFALLATLLYAASALLRTRLQPLDVQDDLARSAASGGYPLHAAIAAGMAALALAERYSGLGLTLAWALEAEFLFLTGLYLRQPFLRGLAAAVFVMPWLQLLGDQVGSNARVAVAGFELREWTPLALLMAASGYLDRYLLHGRRLLGVEYLYSWVATWTLLLVVGTELPNPLMELGWLGLAALLFEAGRAGGLLELRGQGYVVAVVAFLALLALKVAGIEPGPTRPWISLAPAAAFGYAAAMYLGRLGAALGERERKLARALSMAAGTVMAVGFLAHVLPETLVTAGWAVLGTALLVVGFPLGERGLRLSGMALLALCVLKVFVWDLSELAPPFRILSFLVLGLLLLAGSLVYTRSREHFRELLDR